MVKKTKEKTFKLRKCPNCNSDDVGVVIGKNGVWECHKCGYNGRDIKENKLNEEEFMKYLDEKEVPVS